MTRQKKSRLTDVELEVMHVVWDLGSGTVREVHRVLEDRRQIAYTTVMTMMNILEEKGYLQRSKEGRAYVYQPVQPRSEVIATMVDDFVTRVFDGSARPLVMGLIQDRKLSKKDLEDITRMLDETDD
jgi:predicted transcriptional regulator